MNVMNASNKDPLLDLNEARFNRAIATKKLEMPLNTWFAGKCIT